MNSAYKLTVRQTQKSLVKIDLGVNMYSSFSFKYIQNNICKEDPVKLKRVNSLPKGIVKVVEFIFIVNVGWINDPDLYCDQINLP
ncbi:hypothetical protein NQ317_009706 [Molorchus minor]|uniref:Uncharacterized protein n=1 Tax=Molorchus minor TaxID=1323400 RepID=A0ABQ9JKH7_9CUCU|nr:hypothetical protein NQ317_009706 [Molorchus minor]